MKPLCGRDIKGVISCVPIVGFVVFIFNLFRSLKMFWDTCADGESGCPKGFWMNFGISLGGYLLLCIAIVLIRRRLVGIF